MKALFHRLPRTLIAIFSGYNLIWHAFAIILTYILVTTGFDWYYFTSSRNATLFTAMFPAIILGGILPLLAPFALLVFGALRKNKNLTNTAWAMGQAALVGSLLSSFYKFFTGRLQPNLADTSLDISRTFRFGFFKGGIFWGWPSSHTTIAFAMAITLITLYPKNRLTGYLALAYAFYVGFGVSISIHWFSEFAAGVIFGSIIGIVVGNSFRDRINTRI